MTATYAMLDRNNQVRRVARGAKPHPSALPVRYPPLNVDRDENHVVQKPMAEWIVRDGEVVIAYSITPKDLESERKLMLAWAKRRRDSHLDNGVTVTVGSQTAVFATDEVSCNRRERAARDLERKGLGAVRMWRTQDHQWVPLDGDTMAEVCSRAEEHIEDCFRMHRELEAQIRDATRVKELVELRRAHGS